MWNRKLIISVSIILIVVFWYINRENSVETFENVAIKRIPEKDNLFLLLTTRLDSFHNKFWKDISKNHNNLKWNSLPPRNKENLVITRQSGKLVKKTKPSNKEFTIFIQCKTIRNIKNMGRSDILLIPGNEKVGLSVKIDNEYGNIHIVAADKKLKLNKKVMTNDLKMYAIVYEVIKSEKNLRVYVDGHLLEQVKLQHKIYFNDNHIRINKSKNSNFELRTLAIYNNAMTNKEVEEVTDYLEHLEPKPHPHPKPVPGSHSKCFKICQDECKHSGNYKDCFETCAYRLPECREYCKKNPKEPICNTKCRGYDKCPTAYKRDGEFYVYVSKDSIYADMLGRYGEISYGRDRQNAREIYHMNFNKCKIPKVLDEHSHNPHNKKCPFVVKDNNPCRSKYCRDVNWGNNPLKADINKKCRKNINYYCEQNYKNDKACYCWNPKYQDNRYCAKFRRHFDDHKCSPSQFEIDEHPDYSKYIRKDDIPCWNCNITD